MEEVDSLLPKSNDKMNEENVHRARNNRKTCGIANKTIATLLVSVLLGLVSGTLYGFGRYARELKQVLVISQSEVQAYGIWMDCGNYIGHPLAGYIYDHKGPKLCCVLGGLIVFGGYSALYIIMQYRELKDWIWIAFCAVGFGSGLGYLAGLGCTTKIFSKKEHYNHLGSAVGLVAAGYGLCSTLVGLTYKSFGGVESAFFIYWGCLVAIVNLTASFVLQSDDISDSGQSENERDGMLQRGQGLIIDEDNESTYTKIVEVQEKSNQEYESDTTAWETWRYFDFWLLAMGFASVTGCGLFVINNLSTIAQSIGASDEFSGTLIILLSISNVLGRIFIGTLADMTEKIFLLQLSSAAMAFSFVLGALSSIFEEKIFVVPMVILVSMAYGGSWVLVVAILIDLFGKKYFGLDYGVAAMGPALSGMLLNSVSALLYDQNVTSDQICLGTNCYLTSFVMTGFTALFGCFVLEILIRRIPQNCIHNL